MRASTLIVLAVLLAALWAFDKYEYDGHYTKAAWDEINHEANNLLHH